MIISGDDGHEKELSDKVLVSCGVNPAVINRTNFEPVYNPANSIHPGNWTDVQKKDKLAELRSWYRLLEMEYK